MTVRIITRSAILLGVALMLSACGGIGSGDSGWFRRSNTVDAQTLEQRARAEEQKANLEQITPTPKRRTIWDLFGNKRDPNSNIEVNKYLWLASLEILNFLPVESVDPFSGVIVTGYGTPPGGGKAYRATVLIQDPALDARSLKLSLLTRSGPVDVETQRAVEDAILSRARQLRIRDSKL